MTDQQMVFWKDRQGSETYSIYRQYIFHVLSTKTSCKITKKPHDMEEKILLTYIKREKQRS